MKKKGFTLIELLAVIVILAVIALIATPLIMNVINDARKNSFKDSAYGITKAVELRVAKETMGEHPSPRYKVDVTSKAIDYSGDRPTEGWALVEEDGTIALYMCNSSYCAYKESTDKEITVTTDKEEMNQVKTKMNQVKEEAVTELTEESGTAVSCFVTKDSMEGRDGLKIYELVAVDYEIGPNCVSGTVDVMKITQEQATDYCAGKDISINGITMNISDDIRYRDAKPLETAGVITNVVYKKPVYEISPNCVTILMNQGAPENESIDYCSGKDISDEFGTTNIYDQIKSGNTFEMLQDGIITIASYEDIVIDKIITDYDTSCGADVVIPSTISGKKVVGIGRESFYNKGITSVVIPDSVQTIESDAFERNNLAKVTLKGSETILENCAFGDISNISSHNIPDTYQCIGTK